MRMLDKNRANVVFVDCPFFFSVILKHKKQPPRCVCVLSIAGVYNLLLLPAALLLII